MHSIGRIQAGRGRPRVPGHRQPRPALRPRFGFTTGQPAARSLPSWARFEIRPSPGDTNGNMSGSRVNSFDLARLRANLRPFRLAFFPRLRSSNDHAAVLRQRGQLYAPAIVLAARQTAGRGRGGNTWFSTAGCLTVTFVLPIEEHLSPHQLPLIAGLAVRQAAAELAGNEQIGLKWPNDLVYEGKKLAGLLCERTHKADLIGLGLNVNLEPEDAPSELRQRVISLQMIAHQSFDMTEVLIAVAQRLRQTMERRKEQSFAAFLRDYDRHHALVGRPVRITQGPDEPQVSGLCEGLDSTGRLLVRQGDKLHRIIAGQVGME